MLYVCMLASGPGDPLCSGVPDVLLEKAILGAGATEIDFKVSNELLSFSNPKQRRKREVILALI